MLSGINSAISGLKISQTRLNQSAHNVANASTSAYVPSRIDQGDVATGGVRQLGATPLSPGGITVTDRALDLALNGGGFFAVNDPLNGQVYTRSGNFTIDNQGNLADNQGRALTPGINVPAGTSQLSISEHGLVQAYDNNGNLISQSQMQTASFGNAAGLQSLGYNSFAATAASGPAMFNEPGTAGHGGGIVSGALQTSGTDLAHEAVEQIISQRGFEANVKSIQTYDEMIGTLLDLKA